MKKEIITIGFDKNNEADFGIRCDIAELSLGQLNELRKIIPVAIYVAEDMWRREHQPLTGEQNQLTKKSMNKGRQITIKRKRWRKKLS